jgi:hypothetical protein
MPRSANARYHVHGADVAWMRELGDEENVREFAEVLSPLETRIRRRQAGPVPRCSTERQPRD